LTLRGLIQQEVIVRRILPSATRTILSVSFMHERVAI
jgi:hypothetical protein